MSEANVNLKCQLFWPNLTMKTSSLVRRGSNSTRRHGAEGKQQG
jgi:hypothetical protein